MGKKHSEQRHSEPLALFYSREKIGCMGTCIYVCACILLEEILDLVFSERDVYCVLGHAISRTTSQSPCWHFHV